MSFNKRRAAEGEGSPSTRRSRVASVEVSPDLRGSPSRGRNRLSLSVRLSKGAEEDDVLGPMTITELQHVGEQHESPSKIPASPAIRAQMAIARTVTPKRAEARSNQLQAEAELDARLDVKSNARKSNNSGFDQYSWNAVQKRVRRRSRQLTEAVTRSFTGRSSRHNSFSRSPGGQGGDGTTPERQRMSATAPAPAAAWGSPDAPTSAPLRRRRWSDTDAPPGINDAVQALGGSSDVESAMMEARPCPMHGTGPSAPSASSASSPFNFEALGGGSASRERSFRRMSAPALVPAPAPACSSLEPLPRRRPPAQLEPLATTPTLPKGADGVTSKTPPRRFPPGPDSEPAPAPAPGVSTATTGSTPPSSRRWPAPGDTFRSSTSSLTGEPVRQLTWDSLAGLSYLGCGEFCSVWGAKLEGEPVAVKVLKESHANNKLALRDLESETAIMVGLRHDNVLRVLGVGETEGKPFLVLDRVHTTLSTSLPRSADQVACWTRRAEVRRWPLSRALQVGLELAEALRYCHDDAVPGFRVLHRDLKPDNMGLLADGKLVLFDFGLAKLWKIEPNEPPHAARMLTGQTGSARYMAPEVAASRPYGAPAEVYSFAIILWQLLAHEKPFAGFDMSAFKKLVVEQHHRPSIKKGWPPQLGALLKECWHKEPTLRPSMREVCRRLREIMAVHTGVVPGVPGRIRTSPSRGGSVDLDSAAAMQPA